MISKKIDRIIIYKIVYFFNIDINFNMFKALLFININIIYQKISSYFISFIQIVVNNIKIPIIFHNNLILNANSFVYIVKYKC